MNSAASYQAEVERCMGKIAPKESTPLERALESNASGLRELRDAINQLEQRLSMVLTPQAPAPMEASHTKAGLEAVEVTSPAIGELRDQCQRLELLRQMVNGIANRLQA